jgi:hypothetical protein
MATHLQSLCSGGHHSTVFQSSLHNRSYQLPTSYIYGPPTNKSLSAPLISAVHQRTYGLVATPAIPHAIHHVRRHDLASQKSRDAQHISSCRDASGGESASYFYLAKFLSRCFVTLSIAVVGSHHTAKSSPSFQSSPASRPSQKAQQPQRLARQTYHDAAQRPARFRVHPVLTHSSLNYTSISYDVNHPPSSQSVRDCWTHMPIPADMLDQPATEPAILATCQFVLMTDGLPWPVVVSPSTPASLSRGRPGLNDPSTSNRTCSFITVLDVLQALHSSLMMNVTTDEWNSLGRGSRMQQKVAWAYKERCTKMGGGWERGVRRIDWLGCRTRLAGVEVDVNTPASGHVVAKTVFR